MKRRRRNIRKERRKGNTGEENIGIEKAEKEPTRKNTWEGTT